MTDLSTAVSVLIGVGIPLLTGIVVKLHVSRGAKAVVNLLLSAATAVASQTVIDSHTNWKSFVVSIAITWVLSVATHYGLWKPTGVTNVVNLATRNVGIGHSTRVAA